jgi:hypothetical protein
MQETDTTFADVPEGKSAIAVMSEAGDTKYIWDPTNPDEVELAKEHFERMKERGFLVFKLSPWLHCKGKEVKRFHPQGKAYLFVPPDPAAEMDGEVVTKIDAEEEARYIATPPVAGG